MLARYQRKTALRHCLGPLFFALVTLLWVGGRHVVWPGIRPAVMVVAEDLRNPGGVHHRRKHAPRLGVFSWLGKREIR